MPDTRPTLAALDAEARRLADRLAYLRLYSADADGIRAAALDARRAYNRAQDARRARPAPVIHSL